VVTVAGRIKAQHLPSRVADKRSPSLIGSIEGTIIATAVVAGLDEADTVSPLRAFWILLATGTFFWIAHVYADLLAARIKGHHRMGRGDVIAVMSREWPLLQSSFVLAIPLALGAVGALRSSIALDVSWLLGVAALVGWGIVFSRKEGHGFTGVVGAAALNAAVGLLIVGFKVALR
jgi:hypothetical protein